MTCNLLNHETALRQAFERVHNSTSGDWTLFEYEGQSNIVKPGDSGDDGLDEFVQSFESTKVQYGFISLAAVGELKQRKMLLVHWQGAAVPAIRLAHTAAHVEEVRRFVRRVHCTIYARSEEDLDAASIRQKLQLDTPPPASRPAPPTSIPQPPSIIPQPPPPPPTAQKPFVPPSPVNSVFRPLAPKEEIKLPAREKFWEEMRADEEQRKRDDAARYEEQQKQWQLERHLLEKELHEAHTNAAVRGALAAAAAQPPPPPAIKPDAKAKSTLVSGRAQMFDERAAELARASPNTPNRPKQFKFEVALNTAPQTPPVNSGQYQTSSDSDGTLTFVPLIEDAARPVAHIQPLAADAVVLPPTAAAAAAAQAAIFTSDKPQQEQQTEKMRNKKQESPPPSSLPSSDLPQLEKQPTGGEKRAISLWDYKADDDSEISFDANCIIHDIQEIDVGWWRGRTADGYGLFPANYVRLL